MAEGRPQSGMRMGASLTTGMKATMGLQIAFLIFLVVGGIGALLTGPMDIYILVSLAVFVPLVLVLFVFAWRRKPWAYAGTALVGVLIAVASVPIGFPEPAPALVLWETMLATVLGLLLALEGYKAYAELRQAVP
ncbi:MAG: hypothetical protein ACT4OI_02045 [Methanobacteriota archaeon]